MESFHLALFRGCVTGAGLIIAIGAQNAFVLKQGLLQNQVFVTAAFCAFIDAFLISLGVGGVGGVFASSPILLSVAKWGGALFLFWYGFQSFKACFSKRILSVNDTFDKPTLKETLLTLFALTFLNPHVYLDTVILLGSIGAQFPIEDRVFFAIGAMSASVLWFFGLCYGARFLAPLFKNTYSWKCLDAFVGAVMWITAIALLFAPTFIPTECIP